MLSPDILIVLIAFVFINVYLFIRGWQALPSNFIGHSIYTGIILFFVVAPFLGFFFDKRFLPGSTKIFKMIGWYWFIFMTFLFCAALLADLLRIFNFYFKIFPVWINRNYSRLKLLYFSFVLLLMLVFALSGFNRFANPQIVQINLAINKENNGFEDLTYVAVSDIHLGDVVMVKRFTRWIEKINNQKPDVIFLVGDIFDQNFHPNESQNAIKALRQLKARFGVYAVLGNHESLPNFIDTNMAINYLENSGIILLREETFTIDNRINIIGRDDATNKIRKPIELLTVGLDARYPAILLDHQPKNLNESVRNNIDLQISGHLHNGQVYPYSKILSRLWELSYGYRKTGNTQFYVSSGLGLSYLPLRLGTQSEIVCIHLKSKYTE